MKGKVKFIFCHSNIIMLSLSATRRTCRRKSKCTCPSTEDEWGTPDSNMWQLSRLGHKSVMDAVGNDPEKQYLVFISFWDMDIYSSSCRLKRLSAQKTAAETIWPMAASTAAPGVRNNC